MTDLDTPKPVPHSVSRLLEELRSERPGLLGIGPIGTGYEPLDAVLGGGFLPGEVVLLGGQPGVGKTLCALQWARNISEKGRHVTFACFEHDEASLLSRLLIQELAMLESAIDHTSMLLARSTISDLMLGLISLEDAIAQSPVVEAAFLSLEAFSPNLQLLRASSQHTTPHELNEVSHTHLGPGGFLFVDYLQKLPVPGVNNLEERFYHAVEIMKELAITHQITVVALSAVASSGVNAARLRLSDLRGSDALAHESDIVILMNHKVTATSDRHLKFDLTQLDQARKRTIFSIEKNRRGETDVHLEFVKDFGNFRFNPNGSFVSETLVGD